MNKEAHLKPLLTTAVVDNLFGEGVEKIADDKFQVEDRHLNTLTDLIAKDLGISFKLEINL